MCAGSSFNDSVYGMAQSKTKAKAKKEVAIQLYSVRDILNKVDNKDGKCDAAYITLLKNLAKMGYTSVEAANYNNGKFYDRTPDQFKKDVESAGLKVLSSHCTRGLSKEELVPVIFQVHFNGGTSVLLIIKLPV